MRTQALLIGAAVLGVSMLSSAAFATTVDLGDLTPVSAGSANPTVPLTGSVDFIGTFHTTTPFDFSGSTTIAVINQTFTGGTLALWSGTPGSGSELKSAPVSFISAPNSSFYAGGLTQMGLAAGSYYLELTGTASAALSPTLSVSTATSVPELSTWALMGLGFAGLGFGAFSGRRTATSIA